MATNSRLARVVKEEVAQILRREISDPRLQMVTITEADVTNDQAYATIYYSVMTSDVLAVDPARTGGDAPVDGDAVSSAFESATGRIQGLLAKRLTSRRTPELTFTPDPVTEQASRVEELLRNVRTRDQELHASGKMHHGDVNPQGDSRPDPLDADWTPDQESQ